MATAADMISKIEANLANLYEQSASSVDAAERSVTLQDIDKLEKSLEYWRGRLRTESSSSSGDGSLKVTVARLKGMN